MKAKVKNGQVLVWPYTAANLQAENPSTRFGTESLDVALEGLFAKTEEAKMGAELVEVLALPEPSYNPITHRLVPATPVLTSGQWRHNWSIVARTSQEAATTLAGAYSEVEERIKSFRDNRLVNGGFPVTVNSVKKWVHSDTFSRTQWPMIVRRADKVDASGGDMDAILLKRDGTGPLVWKLKGGTGYLPLTANLALQIAQNGEVQDEATFQRCEILIAQMRATANPYVFDFTHGWPEVFGE
jgi:hypothetical protein